MLLLPTFTVRRFIVGVELVGDRYRGGQQLVRSLLAQEQIRRFQSRFQQCQAVQCNWFVNGQLCYTWKGETIIRS